MSPGDHIAILGVVVQIFLFLGLVWYCFETRSMRKASQVQIEVAQRLCLSFRATPRDEVDAVLGVDGAQGTMILDFHEGSWSYKNIGVGPAVNIEYEARPLDRPDGNALTGYVPSVPVGIQFNIPVTRTMLQIRPYEFFIRYESLSGSRYETRTTIHNLVLTPPFRFSEIKKT